MNRFRALFHSVDKVLWSHFHKVSQAEKLSDKHQNFEESLSRR